MIPWQIIGLDRSSERSKEICRESSFPMPVVVLDSDWHRDHTIAEEYLQVMRHRNLTETTDEDVVHR